MLSTKRLLVAVMAIVAFGSGGARADFIYGTTNGTSVTAVDTTNGTTTTVITGLNQAQGVAFDPSGNFYVVDRDIGNPSTSHIQQFTRTGSGAGTFTDVGTYRTGITYALPFGQALVFDQAGNAYAANAFAGVTVFKPDNTTSTITGSISFVYQLAVHGSTLYATDTLNGNVHSADLSQTTPVFTQFANPSSGANGITTDAAGNVYVSLDSGIVEKYSSSGTDLGQFSDVGGSRTGLTTGATDGNLYFVDAPDLYQINGTSGIASHYTGNLLPGTEYITSAAAAVPEPSTVILSGCGIALMLVVMRRRMIDVAQPAI